MEISQLRDIHKLRSNRNVPAYTGQSFRSTETGQIERMSIKSDKPIEVDPTRTFSSRFNETYAKYLSLKETLSENESRTHKRKQSNGILPNDKRESNLSSLPITINMLNQTQAKFTPRTPNPLTSRREKPKEILDYEMMPENEVRDKKYHETNKTQKQQKINKTCFTVVCPIGKGGFGKVWKVEEKKTGEILAMKEMYKAKVIQKKSINSVLNERTLLSKLQNPFIINMVTAFQDRENLYLLMDYIDGGDLRYHIGRRRRFHEREAKFFVANMIIGLEYLHQNNIIHRDMKPENLVFDSEGYLRITDLGISREFRPENSQDTSGTPGYMSPEVICRKNHSYGADYFAVGVMGYEFMLGRRPYIGRNRKEIRDQILGKQACIKPEELPPKWSHEAADFINRLLIRNPSNRLGNNGIEEIKSHPWLSSIDWKKLAKKELQAPFIPLSIEENYDDYKNQISEDSAEENMDENLLMLRDKEVQSLFEDYYFDRQQSQHKKNLSTNTTYSVNSYSTSNF